MVQDALHTLGPSDTQSFILMKLIPPNDVPDESELIPRIDSENIFNPVRDIFQGDGISLHQYFDTMFIGVKNWDLVSLELALEKARSQMETSLNHENVKDGYSVVYATASYPREGHDSSHLYRLLVNRLMSANNKQFIN